MRRTAIVIFLTMLLLWVLVSQLNHFLAVWRVYLFVGGLLVTYAALRLPLRTGLLVTAGIGLLAEVGTGLTLGTYLVLLCAAHALIYHVRDRVPRDQTVTRVLIALLANLALFLLLSILLVGQGPWPASVWPRLIFDLVCSQVFVALVAPWFFALQEKALELAGATSRRLL
jgi:rod shape-determining protein MreD